jgi:hypothetical protein
MLVMQTVHLNLTIPLASASGLCLKDHWRRFRCFYFISATSARAGVAVPGNYNWLSSFHVPLIFDATPQFD